eukprot:403330967
MSDYLNWEKIALEYNSAKLKQNALIKFVKDNQINNLEDFDQKKDGLGKIGPLKWDYMFIQQLIKKNLNKFLINPPPSQELAQTTLLAQPAINLPNTSQTLQNDDPYKQNFSQQEEVKQQEQQIFQQNFESNFNNAEEKQESIPHVQSQVQQIDQHQIQSQRLATQPPQVQNKLQLSDLQTTDAYTQRSQLSVQQNIQPLNNASLGNQKITIPQTQRKTNRHQNEQKLLDFDEEVKVEQNQVYEINQSFQASPISSTKSQYNQFNQETNQSMRVEDLQNNHTFSKNEQNSAYNQPADLNLPENLDESILNDTMISELTQTNRLVQTYNNPVHSNVFNTENQIRSQKDFLLNIRNDSQSFNESLIDLKLYQRGIYDSLCKDAEIFGQSELFIKSCQDINKYKKLKTHQNRCEKIMLEAYKIDQHIGYSLYLIFGETLNFQDPTPKEVQKYSIQIQSLQMLLSENQDCIENIQNIIEELKSENLQESHYFGFQIFEENQVIGKQVLVILKEISSQKIQKEIENFLRYQQFYNDLTPEIRSMKQLDEVLIAIQDNDEVNFNKNYKVLNTIQQEYAIELLQLLSIHYEELFKQIQDEKLHALLNMQQKHFQTQIDTEQNNQSISSIDTQQAQVEEPQTVDLQQIIDQNDFNQIIAYIQNSNLNEQQTFEIFNKVLKQQQSLPLYESLIQNYQEMFKSNQEYSRKFSQIEKKHKLKDSLIFIQEKIDDMFNELPHHSYSLYLSFRDKINLKNPLETYLEQQKTNEILHKVEKILNSIGLEQDKIMEFQTMIQENQVNEVLTFAQSISDLDENAFLFILEILQSSSEEFNQQINNIKNFMQMKEEIVQFGVNSQEIEKYLSCIQTLNLLESINYVNQVILLESSQAKGTLNIVQKYFPEAIELIPNYKLILVQDMEQNAKRVLSGLIEFLENLKQNPSISVNKKKIEELNQILQQIYQQNAIIYDSILQRYQTQVLAYGLFNPTNNQNEYVNQIDLQSSGLNQNLIDAIKQQDKVYLLHQLENINEEQKYQTLAKAYIFNIKFYEALIIEPIVINLDRKSYEPIKKFLDLNSKISTRAAQCQEKIDDYYQINQHLAASLYVQYRQKIYLVDPHQISNLKKCLDDYILSSKNPTSSFDDEQSYISEELQLALEELHQLFENKLLEEFVDKIIEISALDQGVGKKLFEIVENTSSTLNQSIKRKSTFKQFTNSLSPEIEQNLLLQEFLKALLNQDQEKANNSLKLISILEQSQTSILMQAVEKYYPHMKDSFPEEKILLLECPSKIRDLLETLINKIQEFENQNINVNSKVLCQMKDIKECETCLEKIFQNSYEYFQKIMPKYSEQLKTMNVQLPRSIREKQSETLKKINEILEVSDRNKKIKIQQFYEVDDKFQYDLVEQQLIDGYLNKKKMHRQLLTQILFHYIKRRLDFNYIIEKFLKCDPSFPLTRSVLILYLLENADENLRILLVVSLSLYIPIPLYGISWKQMQKPINTTSVYQLQETQEELAVIIPKELIYVYERFKSVLNFCISGNDIKKDYPQSTEKFINKLFNKNFESVNDKYSNYGTIEIQFDYNFSKPQYIPVANCNGPLSIQKIQKVMMIFNIFILHVNSSMQQDPNLLNEFIEVIRNSSTEQKLLIIIDHNPSQENQEFSKEETSSFDNNNSLSTQILQYKIKPYHKMIQAVQNNLCEQIIKNVKDFQEKKPEAYLASIQRRQQTIDSFNTMLKSNSIQNDDIENALQNASSIIQSFEDNSENLHSFEFLPMNFLFEKSSQLNFELQYDNELDRESIRKKENLSQGFLDQMEIEEISPIINDLIGIITNHNTFGCFMIINKLIKGCLNDKLKQIYQKRVDLGDKIKTLQEEIKKNKDKNQENNLNQMLQSVKTQAKDITNDIEKKSFSYEYIIRELYLLGQYRANDNEKTKYRRQYNELCYQLIDNTQPFEVIDGNNLSFVSDVYEDLFKNHNDEVFVVSVIGPQSSGKSLLLNFLFGTQFQSSEGRCTKGVYGAIINVKTEGNKKRRILILDTEGIQAAEARDDRFDRRIVFYTLCVSHVVLICNRGEMNNQMAEILKLAAESISNLKENIIKPNVFVVMNMLSSTDNVALSECIQKLSSAISELDSISNTQQLFQLSSKNVTILPFAFYMSGENDFVINQPSLEFSVQLEPLKRKILNCMQQIDSQNGKDKMSTHRWFDFACKLWNFTEKFKGMMEYKDLEQKLMEASIKEIMNILIQKNFEDKLEANKDIIDSLIIKDLKQFEGNQSIQFNLIFNKIESSILEKFLEIETSSSEDFISFCTIKNVPSDFKTRNHSILRGQMNYYKEQWINQAKEKVTLFVEQKSKKVGHAKLNEIITKLLKVKNKYKLGEAEELFEQQWKKIEEEIVSMTRKDELIRQDTHKFIRNLYYQEMGGSYYANNQKEIELISEFYNKSNKALLNEFQILKQSMLYFTGGTIIPNPQKLFGALNMNKKFMKNLNADIIFIKRRATLYYWKKLLQERVDRNYICRQFTEYLTVKGYLSTSFNDAKKDQIKAIYRQLNDELYHVNIQIKGLFFQEANELTIVLKKRYNNDKDIKNQAELKQFIDIYLEAALFEEVDKYFYYREISSISYIGFRQKYQYQYVRTDTQFQNNGKENKTAFHIIDYIQSYQGEIEYKKNDVQVLEYQSQTFIDTKCILKANEKQYFTYLANIPKHTSLSDKSDATLAGMKYVVNNLINLEYIIEEIESIVIKKLKCDDVKEDKETITNLIADLKIDKGDELKQKLRKLNRNVIQDVAIGVKSIIQQLNEDLDRFAFKLSEKGISLLHLTAQVFLITLGEQLLIKIEQGSLENLRHGKQIQKQLFIAKLTSNQEELDQGIAIKLAKDAQNYLILKFTQEAVNEFKQVHQRNESKFIKKDLVREIEDQALKIVSDEIPLKSYDEYQLFQNEEDNNQIQIQNLQNQMLQYIPQKIVLEEEDKQMKEIIDYFIDPKIFFTKRFNKQWKDFSKHEIQKIKENFSRKLKKSLLVIYNFFEELKYLIEKSNNNEPSISLFTTTDDSDNDLQFSQFFNQPQQHRTDGEPLKELVNKAAAQYIIHLVRRDLPNDRIISVENIRMRCGQDNKPMPKHIDMNQYIDDETIPNIEQSLQGEQISNIMGFLQNLLNEINHIIEQNIQLESDDLIIGEAMQMLKTKFIGCDEYCPLCRMQCDVSHNPNESLQNRVHECTQGHRIQGFGGNKNLNGNAIIITCSDLKDNNDVTYERQKMKWSNFQQLPQFKNWKFTIDDQSELKMWKEKNIILWNYFGRLICEIYQRRFYVNMNFKQASVKTFSEIHYILLLDNSYSMKGQRWDDLMACVKTFMEIICADIIIQKHSRITTLTYDHEIHEIFEEKVPDLDLLDQIQYIGGNTSFSKPFNYMKECIQKHIENYDKFVVCFISDGEASYPQSQLQEITADQALMSKLDFRCIFQGEEKSGANLLRGIAAKLGGTMKQCIELSDLKEEFINLVPNIYQ